eukprot:CAMPEP_0113679480 /NCGR_PEP_ID=MMETSP0038_2-20120614/10668_1 /TAXON_ID=2898 /ORGANISM="Cryptomonas paramecium" /LENGTH=224 /DNA_ID=CAMNT_0000597517 /DNA_START=60 /DNA_END=734 /DNA_ORIENTATION=- /assembly_acc=CAM_ASM_000170
MKASFAECSDNDTQSFTRSERPASAQNNGRPGQPRALLSGEQAAQIYMYRKSTTFSVDPRLSGNANAVAAKYGISSKTVRDIWNRRTWAEETQHLWNAGDKPVIRSRRRMMMFLQSYATSTSVSSPQPLAWITYHESSASSSCSNSCPNSPQQESNDDLDIEDAYIRECRRAVTLPHEACGHASQPFELGWECGMAPLDSGLDDLFDVAWLMREPYFLRMYDNE